MVLVLLMYVDSMSRRVKVGTTSQVSTSEPFQVKTSQCESVQLISHARKD